MSFGSPFLPVYPVVITGVARAYAMESQMSMVVRSKYRIQTEWVTLRIRKCDASQEQISFQRILYWSHNYLIKAMALLLPKLRATIVGA